MRFGYNILITIKSGVLWLSLLLLSIWEHKKMAAARLTFQCLDIVKKKPYVSCLIYNILGYLCYFVPLIREQWPWEISPLATPIRPDRECPEAGVACFWLTSQGCGKDSKVRVFPSPKFLTTSFGLFRRDDEWGCQSSSSLSPYPQPGGLHVNRS